MMGYQAIPALINRAGLPVVYTMIAGTNAPWLGEGVRTGAFRLVRTRHEETAVAAATAHTRVTGTLGVCTVQRGPGFANSINALLAATHCHSPMLMIVAESPATKELSAKNIDQRRFSELIGAGFHHVATAAELEDGFQRAVAAAYRAGVPQVLSIGDGVLEGRLELTGDPTPAEVETPEAPEPESISACIDVLVSARRPLIIAGQGAVLSGCRGDLERLAELTGAPLATTLYATHLFAGHANNIGLCGTWAPNVALEYLTQADVVAAFGASLNGYTTASGAVLAGAKVIHCEVDVERPCLASAPELALLCDAGVAARALVRECERWGMRGRPTPPDAPTLADIRAGLLRVDLGNDPARGIDVRHAYAVLDERLPAGRIVVTDSGRHLAPIPTLISVDDARSWVMSRGYGSVGLGIGAAIGAASATNRPVVLLCGDGGLMMAAQDLDAVRINGLDLTVVVLNDEMYGSEIKHLVKYGLDVGIAAQPLPDIPTLAAAFGGRGVVVRTLSELEHLEVRHGGLTIIDVRIDPFLLGAYAVN